MATPLQYSCLKNPMNRGAWRVTVYRVTKSQTQLKGLSTQAVHMKQISKTIIKAKKMVGLPMCMEESSQDQPKTRAALGMVTRMTLSLRKPITSHFAHAASHQPVHFQIFIVIISVIKY